MNLHELSPAAGSNTKGYRKLKIPSAGQLLNEKDIKVQQLKIDG